MTVVLRTVDLTPVQDAIVHRDRAVFASVASELGLELSLDAFLEYARPFYSAHPEWLGRKFFEMAYAALHGNSDYDCFVGVTILVVRAGDRIVCGMQRSPGRSKPFPKNGWKIGRWYKDPARNRATVEAWANDPERERDALIVPIIREPDAVASGDARGEALLADVVANPDDEGARLVYADWLVEQGDVRGELIRVQCELQGTDHEPERLAALQERQRQLVESAGAGMRADVESYAESARIVRGLIEQVEIRVAKLAKYGAELFAKHPIRTLHVLVKGPDELARLVDLPWIARVPHLHVEARKTPRILMSRAALQPSTLAKHLPNTRELTLSYVDDDTAEWERFFRELEAPKLERLRIVHPGFAPSALASYAGPPCTIAIEYPMFARDVSSTGAIIDAFARVPPLTGFEFSAWYCGDATLARCVRSLLAQPTFTSLKISNSSLGDATLAAICDGGAALERLEIYDRMISPLFGLFSYPFPALRELELSRHAEGVPPETRDELAEKILTWTSPARFSTAVQFTDEQRARLGRRLVRP